MLKTRNALARVTLRRWTAQARPGVLAGLGLQLIGTLGWIGLSFGISQAVAALASGTDATPGLVMAACAIVVRAIAGWLAEITLSAAGRRLTQSARTELFEALAQSGPGWLVGEATGARVSQLTDRTARLAGYASRWQPGIGLAIIAPIAVLVAVATQSWLAAILLLTSVLVLPVFIWLTASGTAATARAQQAALDQLSGGFQSRAVQAGLIRAFRATRREAARLEADAETLRQRTMAVLRMAFLSTAVLEFFASVSIALVAVYVGFKLLGVFPFSTSEEVTLAEGLTALLLAPEFFAPIRRLSTLHHDRADAVAAVDFLSRWLDSRPSSVTPRAPRLSAAPVIAFHSTRLAWPDGTVAIDGLTLTAQPGQITVLTGPSGAGKTTALLALLGHTCTLDGQILINGTPLAPRQSLAESVAYVGQMPWLMEGSLRANIAIAAPDAPAGALERAALLSGVLDFATPEHGGLDRPLARFGAGLSGGQRQRIALARAILRDAPILLLDEPTAHLDALAEMDLLARLRALATGRTVLVASHSDPVIRCADVRVVLPGDRQEPLA